MEIASPASGHPRVWALVGLLHLGALYGCGAQPASEDLGAERAKPLADRMALLDRDLVPSAHGTDVLALHDYLAHYGYLPNDELPKKYPEWKPSVAATPEDPMTFDDTTTEAVRALQRSLGLAETGVLDAATRVLVKQPRCSVPEGVHSGVDPAEKFALHGDSWGYPNPLINWQTTLPFGSIPAGLDFGAVHDAISAAVSAWADVTSLDFVEAGTVTTMWILFDSISDPGSATFPSDGGDVTLALDQPWSLATPTPSNKLDLQSIALHEIGHALGLEHSSTASPVPAMFPVLNMGNEVRSPSLEDETAISALYDTWTRTPGAATDIGTGADGSVWVIGDRQLTTNGGYGIFKYNRWLDNWIQSDGAALRIAVDRTGRPWVTAADGTIWRRNSDNPSVSGWTGLPGCATDIGIGLVTDPFTHASQDVVWSIGCTANGAGGNIVQKWDPGTSSWKPDAIGAGYRIAVDPDGRPWVIAMNGTIWHLPTSAPNSGTWVQMFGYGTDIGIGPYGTLTTGVSGTEPTAWLTGTDNVNGGHSVYVWDQQGSLGVAGPHNAPARKGWIKVPAAAATAISVGPEDVWVVNSFHGIFHQTN